MKLVIFISEPVIHRIRRFVKYRYSKLITGCSLLLLLPIAAVAFENLTPLQNLVYDTAHLENTNAEQVVAYDYVYTDNEATETVQDKVLLRILSEREEGRRDVSIDFLSEERRIHLPNFDNYRGNPVIIAMLEHLAQSMGRDTGGGALYFRNRIRDSLASKDIDIVEAVEDKGDTPYDYSDYRQFVLEPFVGDQYLADRPEYTQAHITFRFSDSVPGQLVSIKLVSGPADEPKLTRELMLAGPDG